MQWKNGTHELHVIWSCHSFATAGDMAKAGNHECDQVIATCNGTHEFSLFNPTSIPLLFALA